MLSTDGSRDIPSATAAHDAELDREAVEGMEALPAAGVAVGEQTASADIDVAIIASREAPPAPAQIPIFFRDPVTGAVIDVSGSTS